MSRVLCYYKEDKVLFSIKSVNVLNRDKDDKDDDNVLFSKKNV